MLLSESWVGYQLLLGGVRHGGVQVLRRRPAPGNEIRRAGAHTNEGILKFGLGVSQHLVEQDV
jgi:hypothetical protein